MTRNENIDSQNTVNSRNKGAENLALGQVDLLPLRVIIAAGVLAGAMSHE